jgi:asparagine synthase (glutamine-hydrolysing)
MCGFVAILSRDGHQPDPAFLARMTDLLAHRGPDDSGFFIEGPVGLGFRRLAILDLAPSGHQPMTSADNRHVIVFNGEIYNYVELRKELVARGHVFRSTGDTEVLLAAYREWGPACLERLNGMWAFVIYDRVERRIFGARDRFGVKPLFLYRDATRTVLASEIKALRDSGYARLEVDQRAIADFLLEGRLDSTNRTFYSGVTRISPGTAFEADATGDLRFFRYWSLLDAAGAGAEPADPPAAYAELFEDAVRLRMRADVPVGVLLSGGLDSTSIMCAMARVGEASQPQLSLNAFCYMSSEFDETRYIEATLRQTAANLCRLQEEPRNLWADLERHLWFQDEPVHSFTSVIGYQLMGLARSHGVKVLLNGQGADEVLAGYGSYFSEYWADLVWAGHLWQALQEVRAYGKAHGRQVARRQVEQALRCAAGRLAHRLPAHKRASQQRLATRLEGDAWVSGDVKRAWVPEQHATVESLQASLQRSLEHDPLPLYLRVEDRNSMAHGVEVRLPFMDYRLVAFAFRLGSRWKLRGGYNKFLLREAMNDRIPPSVRTRVDKFGFPNSADHWFRTELYQPFRDLLSSRSVRESGLWQVDTIEHALEQHRRGECSIGSRLFDVAQLCMWLEGSRRWPADMQQRPVTGAELALAV